MKLHLGSSLVCSSDSQWRTASCRSDRLPRHNCTRAVGSAWRPGQPRRLERLCALPLYTARSTMFPYPILLSQSAQQRPVRVCRSTGPSSTSSSTAIADAASSDSSSVSNNGDSSRSTPGPPATRDFDLSLAVALAAAAFEAYLEPSGADGFQERTVNGTEVMYTDRRFLQEHFEGVLQLNVKSARGLKAVNVTSRASDPYVTVSIGDNCASTSVKWGTTAPTWDETHMLYVVKRDSDMMRLRVFDKGGAILNMQADKDLGAVVLPVASLENGKEVELQLKGPEAQGSVTISAAFLPFGTSPQGKAALEAATNTTDLVLPGTAATAAVVATAIEGDQQPKAPRDNDFERQATKAVQDALQLAVQLLPKDPQLDPVQLQRALQVAGDSALESAAAYAERVSQQLADAGVDAKTIDSIMSQARQAAHDVQRFMSGSALGSVPISQLKKLLASIGAMRTEATHSQSVSGSATSSREGEGSSRDISTTGGLQQGQEGQQEQREQGQEGQQGQELQQDSALAKLEQAHLPGAWKALAGIAGRVIDDSLVPIAFVENSETDTQVWVYRNEEEREVVVAFRGTEQVKWKDFISDLNFIPTSLDEERSGVSSLLPFASFKKNTDVMVHSGFLNAYDSVRPKLLRLIDALTPPPRGSTHTGSTTDSTSSSSAAPSDTTSDAASSSTSTHSGDSSKHSDDSSDVASASSTAGSSAGSFGFGMGSREWFSKWWSSAKGGGRSKEEQPWRVYVTGHSLGGALATLCAYELAGRRRPHQQVAMYTYGSPRVGNTAFAEAFNERVPGSWRFYNASDIVPSVPRLMGYKHVKHAVRLTGSGGLEFEESSKDVLGEGREISDVLQELADKAVGVAQGRHTFDSVVDELKEHEMDIFFALVDGSALAQHMEDYYLQTLKECVLLADPSLKEQFETAIAEVVASQPAAADAKGAEPKAPDADSKEDKSKA